MKKITFILLMICWQAAMAQVEVALSQPSAAVDEDFTVTFTYQRSNASLVPDFSALEKSFTIVGTAQSSQVMVVNGQVSSQTQWRVTLNAAKEGEYTIPAIQFGNEKSKPLTINISEQPTEQKLAQDKTIFMETDVDIKQPYVQQQLIFRFKLYYRLSPSSGDFIPPKASNALVSQLGEGRQYQTMIDGQRYAVVEQKYLIFPEKSGELRIHAPIFKGTIRRTNINSIDQIMMDLHKKVRVTAPSLELDVKPIPSAFKGQTWLPASNVSLTDRWQEANQKAAVGQPMTRIVTLKATGLMASQLPELKFDSSAGVKVYAEPSESKDLASGDSVIGKKVFKVVYIPTGSQDITLPEISLDWWNVKTNQNERAILKEQHFLVSGKSETRPAKQDAEIEVTKPTSKQIQPAHSAAKKHKAIESSTYSWQVLLPWSLVIILSSLLSWLVVRRNHAPSTVTATCSVSKQLSEARKQLKQACKANQPQQAQIALLSWAKAKWPNQAMRQLGALKAQLEPKSALEQAIQGLQSALYGDNLSWSGAALWQAFSAFEATTGKVKKKRNKEVLPPFNYRHSS